MNEDGQKYIDSHIHLYHRCYEDKGREIMRETIETGYIDRVVIAPIDWDTNIVMREMFQEIEFGEYVSFAAGYHPKCVNHDSSWRAERKKQFAEWLADKRTVAVKTGLDYANKKLLDLQKEKQKDFMKMFIDYANGETGPDNRKRALELHIREAAEEAIEVLSEHPVKTNTEVHCFTYGYDVARRFMENGVEYFGIGGHITLNDADDLRDAVSKLPLSSILVETDGPFKMPQGIDFPRPACMPDANVSTPLCLPRIVEVIADIKHLPAGKVADRIYQNTLEFFGWE